MESMHDMEGGEFYVSKPAADCPHVLGVGGKSGSSHSIGRPRGRAGGPFLIGRPSLRGYKSGLFLLGRPPGSDRRGGSAPCDLEGESGAGVYVLEKDDGDLYVGKSGNIAERIRQHLSGLGASCAKGVARRLPPMTPPICGDLEAWERAETLARMRRHGISRVRGWMYTSPEMSDADRDHAFHQICEKHDLCRRCGKHGHFAAQCSAGGAYLSRPSWAK